MQGPSGMAPASPRRWLLAAVVFGLAASFLPAAPARPDTYAGAGAVVTRDSSGTLVDSGGVVCTPGGGGWGGACLPFTPGMTAVVLTDSVSGTAAAFQVCVDNDGNRQCGGPPVVPGCDDAIVFSHNDNGLFYNPLTVPTGFTSGCPGGFPGWVVYTCQGVHTLPSSNHTHDVAAGVVDAVASGSSPPSSGGFCGTPSGLPGKPYVIMGQGSAIGTVTAGDAASCTLSTSLSHERCTGGSFSGIDVDIVATSSGAQRQLQCAGSVAGIGFSTRETVAEGRGLITPVGLSLPGTLIHSGSSSAVTCSVSIVAGAFHRVGTVALGRLRIDVRAAQFTEHFCGAFSASAVPTVVGSTVVTAVLELDADSCLDPGLHGRDPGDDTVHG